MAAAEESSSSEVPLPTPVVNIYPNPGTYTMPASTITVTAPTTVPVAHTTTVSSSGVYTFGGVTTEVTASTTITAFYASVETAASNPVTKIFTTIYVCPSSGTYTIAPTTTTVSESTIWVYPLPTEYPSGTYTHPATTITITKTSQTVVCPYTSVTPTGQAPVEHSAPAPVTSEAAAPSAPASEHTPYNEQAPSTMVEEHPSPAPEHESYEQPAPSTPVEAHAAPAPEHESYEPAAPASPAVEAHAPPAAAASTSHEEDEYAAPAPSPAPVESEAASESAAAASSSAAPSASPASSAIGGGSHWAMTYSPYRADSNCKDRAEVEQDVAEIAQKGFGSIRLYGTDCDGLANAGGAAQRHGLKVVAGVFIDSRGIAAARKQVDDLIGWGQWSAVEMIVIGNEALFNGHCSGAELAAFIGEAKAQLRAAGYGGPCTTTEATVQALRDNADALCPVLDVLALNIHAFFNGKVRAADAGEFVAAQLGLLADVCPGKATYNLESGWPSGGDANGDAIPGEAEQREAIASIEKAAGGKVVFFSYV